MKSTSSSHVRNSVTCNVSMMYIVFVFFFFFKEEICIKRHIFACKENPEYQKKTKANVTHLDTV